MVTKVTFVPESFTRKPPKFERFIRPTGLRFRKAHVTHPELKTTFYLPIIGVKRNPSSAMYTSLGVITKGTIIEVNISELGMVTAGGKVVWGKYAQVMRTTFRLKPPNYFAPGPSENLHHSDIFLAFLSFRLQTIRRMTDVSTPFCC